MAALNPLLEIVNGCSCEYETTAFLPAFFIVGKICVDSVGLIVKAEHHFVFIERAVRVVLVNNNHTLAIPAVYVIRQEHVYMVAVYALGASDVAVGVVHGGFPLLAVCVSTTAHRADRLLYCHVKRANLNMAFLIVPRLFLCLCRIGVHIFLGGTYPVGERTFWCICLFFFRQSTIFVIGNAGVLQESCVTLQVRWIIVSVCRLVD
ncbi:unknown [Prevotella sp. CAG:873]|nr:unknown [Prevotella sp. CAG:873]